MYRKPIQDCRRRLQLSKWPKTTPEKSRTSGTEPHCNPILIPDTPLARPWNNKDSTIQQAPNRSWVSEITVGLGAVVELITPGNNLLNCTHATVELSEVLDWTGAKIQRWDESSFPLDDVQPITSGKKQWAKLLVKRGGVIQPLQSNVYKYSQNGHTGLLRRKAQLQVCITTETLVVNNSKRLARIAWNQVRKCHKIEREVVHLRREVLLMSAKLDLILEKTNLWNRMHLCLIICVWCQLLYFALPCLDLRTNLWVMIKQTM